MGKESELNNLNKQTVTQYRSESGKLFNTLLEAELDNLEYMKLAQTPSKWALKLKLIPTKNKINIIDNFSPNYNYVVEGNKVYYSLKGKDWWVDISNNIDAKKNLLKFLHDKYDFKGYQDGERELYNTLFQVKSNPLPNKTKTPVKDKHINASPFVLSLNNELVVRNLSRYLYPWLEFASSHSRSVSNSKKTNTLPDPKRHISTTGTMPGYSGGNLSLESLKVKNPGDVGTIWNTSIDKGPIEAMRLAYRGLKRKYAKDYGNEEESSLNIPSFTLNSKDTKYNIVLPTFTGDTINYKGAKHREYILPESINLNDVRLGYRNRGNNEAIRTEGGIITTFYPFKKLSERKTQANTYVGIDSNGKLKAGPASIFGPNDIVAPSYSNDIVSFKRDSKGNIVYKRDGAHGNASRSVPVTITTDGKEGSINILTDRHLQGDKYYNVAGGRVIMKVGNELRLVSGSIEDIVKIFEDLKKKHGVSYGTFFGLDNGTYNTGLRTRDKWLTTSDLRKYDLRNNNSGGNFLYLLPLSNVYASDTVQIPNIRTTKDESYKKGHPLVNERYGVVLHHTADMNPDLGAVTRKFLNPKSGTSSHIVIGFDGKRRVFARPDLVTFHAGASMWKGRTNLNDFMIGIEFLGDTTKKELTDALVKSAVEYLKPIIRANNIHLENIVSHAQIRELYNDYQKKHGGKTTWDKVDISPVSYNKIITELLNLLYYPKYLIGGVLPYEVGNSLMAFGNQLGKIYRNAKRNASEDKKKSEEKKRFRPVVAKLEAPDFNILKLRDVSSKYNKRYKVPMRLSKVKLVPKYENQSMTRYMNALEGSRGFISEVFPNVDFDKIIKANIAVLKRETNFNKNKNSDSEGLIHKLIRKSAYVISGKEANDISSNLSKTKLNTFSAEERKLLGLNSPADLEDYNKAALANSYNLAKNMDYFLRYSKMHPELKLTDDDIENLTILSYNQGMSTLKNIGYNNKGELDLSEIERIRYLAKPNSRIRDYTSTNYRHLDKLMPGLGKAAYDALDKSTFIPYISSAKNSYLYIKENN